MGEKKGMGAEKIRKPEQVSGVLETTSNKLSYSTSNKMSNGTSNTLSNGTTNGAPNGLESKKLR